MEFISSCRTLKAFCLAALMGFSIFLADPYVGAAPECGASQESGPPQKSVFGFKDVVEKARTLSRTPYKDPRAKFPQWLLQITYDEMRDIRFGPGMSHWRKENLPFELQFFHAGLYFDRTVKIHELTSAGPVPIKFSTDLFVYEKSARDLKKRVPKDLGFAGFRIHGNVNTPDYKDEVAVFLGASYFRAVAQGQVYGLSARGVAVDTAEPSGEEFPWFCEFWIQRPAPDDPRITVNALLDGPRITGAYSFVITPGVETLMEVESTLFLRKEVNKLGISPMTSMFFYSETTNIRPKDIFRPEIHDSDGLAIHMENGEWLWRPLSNPPGVWVNAFQSDNPLGFGLINRDLNFDRYQDLEARYDRRPSLWCERRGNWGKGWIELVQIPTDDEIHDNIVAYWRPEQAPPGEPLSFAYTLSWHFPDERRPPTGRVVASRTEKWKKPDTKTFILDFEGGGLEKLGPGDAVEGDVSVGPGARLVEQQVYKNVVTGGWRLVFQLKPENDPPPAEGIAPERRPLVELRAYLKRSGSALTETWSYASPL